MTSMMPSSHEEWSGAPGLATGIARAETPDCASWSGILDSHARAIEGKRAYVTLDGAGAAGQALTYGELRASARRIGACLTASLAAQSRILILLPQDLSFIKAYVSCLIAGMVAVPAYLPGNGKHVKKVQSIFADAGPQAILWSEAATPRLRSELRECRACEAALWIDIDAADSDTTDSGAADSARESDGPDVSPDQLAMLQYTSGSTGEPKGVMLTHRNLLANQEMIRETFGHSRDSIVVAALPLYHDMGLIGNILQPLYLGATCFFLSPREVVRQPLSWLQSISRHRATTSGGPNAYYDLCIDRVDTSAGLDGLDLSSWRVAFNGAEPIHASTLETFARKFACVGFQPSAFLPVYGLAEASLLVTGRRKAPLPTIARLDRSEYERGRIVDRVEPSERASVSMVGCGRPASGVELVIRGADGQHLRERDIGEILVRSASVAQGYWRSSSDEGFEVATAATAGGDAVRYLRTGDLGFVADDELFVTGRLKEVMIVRGRNYYPTDIEVTATQACDATAGGRNAVFSIDVAGREEIVVVQEVARDQSFDPETVRRAITLQCWNEHEIQLYDIVLVRAGTVPRTTSGKTRRLLVKQLYAAGKLPALDAADASADVGADRASLLLQQFLVDAFRSYFPGHRDQIDANTSMSALALDSFSLVRLSDEIGERLGVEIPLMEVVKRSTIADLANHIAAHRASFKPRSDVLRPPAIGTSRSKTRQSHGQMALWHREKTPVHGSALVVSRAVRVGTRLDPELFQAAATTLIERYDILRTELREESGECVQIIAPERRPNIEHVDASDWDDARVSDYLAQQANARIDLAKGELWRWFLLDRSDSSIVLFTFHHIICDLETVNLLIEAFFRACSTTVADRVESATGDVIYATYDDYVDQQYDFLASEAGRRSGEFWRQALQHVDLKVDLVSRKSRQAGVDAGFRELVLGPSSTDALLQKSTEAHVGLNVLLLAAFAVTLKRYTQQERFAIGVPVSARTHRRFRHTLGYMVNVLPIVVDFSAAPPFGRLVEQVREHTLLALEYQQYPLPLIIQQYRRDHPRFVHDLDIMNVEFVYQKASLPGGQDTTAFALNTASATPAIVGDLELFSRPVKAREVEFPVKMTAGVSDGSLTVHLQWDSGTMYDSVMSTIMADYDGLLKRIIGAHEL
jgi:acyl-CoA synthetase (AMP-forming)/AMP-acid ligase II/acyl carrier protein